MSHEAGPDDSTRTGWRRAAAALRAVWSDLADADALEPAWRRAALDGAPPRLASDDDHLAWGCLLGSSQAARALDERCLSPVVPRLRGMGLSPAAIDDVLADARLKLLAGTDTRPPALARHQGRGSLAGYVRAITVRIAIDGLRRQRGHDDNDEIDEIAEVAIGGLDDELTRAAHGALVSAAFRQAWHELPAHTRLLLSQQVIDRLSIDEIGALHGVHRATAARRCIAARETLLARLRGALHAALGVNTGTADSILRNAVSRISAVMADGDGARVHVG